LGSVAYYRVSAQKAFEKGLIEYQALVTLVWKLIRTGFFDAKKHNYTAQQPTRTSYLQKKSFTIISIKTNGTVVFYSSMKLLEVHNVQLTLNIELSFSALVSQATLELLSKMLQLI
jgi:hypothetical protein